MGATFLKATFLLWAQEQGREQGEKNPKTQIIPAAAGAGVCGKASGGHGTMRTFLWLRRFRFLFCLIVDLGEEKWE